MTIQAYYYSVKIMDKIIQKEKEMKGISPNPYLPLYEYVPDGEPRIFENRLYIYGSHDTSGGNWFCLEDYVVWSAPLNDLSSWHYEGISYRKDQDPHNSDGQLELFAPDVVQGPDRRYYLFYCIRKKREFGVAVSDSPAGPFHFYGHVHYTDGTIFQKHMPYDPSVLVDDDGRIYLYYGYTCEEIAVKLGGDVSPGCMVIELDKDMLTVKGEPLVCLPRDTDTKNTGFEGHGYYEAPSMRKINGNYYLVYSSEVCHELCYAISSNPTQGFSYGGVIVSNGDIGLNGRKYPVCLPGNNHGGLVCINGQYYIFYQRHTQCTQFSRQGCAEPVKILPDGAIAQVEITSSGLTGGPLDAKGTWSAAYACHLTHKDSLKMLLYRKADPAILPCIREDTTIPDESKRVQYIHNITDGTTIGYKYFRADHITGITLSMRGSCDGTFELYSDHPESGTHLASLPVSIHTEDWREITAPVSWNGVHALYIIYRGSGNVCLKDIAFT